MTNHFISVASCDELDKFQDAFAKIIPGKSPAYYNQVGALVAEAMTYMTHRGEALRVAHLNEKGAAIAAAQKDGDLAEEDIADEINKAVYRVNRDNIITYITMQAAYQRKKDDVRKQAALGFCETLKNYTFYDPYRREEKAENKEDALAGVPVKGFPDHAKTTGKSLQFAQDEKNREALWERFYQTFPSFHASGVKHMSQAVNEAQKLLLEV